MQMTFGKLASAHFKDELARYTKDTEKSVEEALTQVAKIAARNLASKVQPYGVAKKQGEKLEMSIAKQVHRAIRHSNVAGQNGDASTAHRQNRDSRGRVPKGLKTDGQFKRDPIEPSDRIRQAQKKMANAGMAKAGWITAHDLISSDKAKGIAQYIRRHQGKNGACNKHGSGMKHNIILENNCPYIESVQSQKDVMAAIKSAYENFTKFMIIRRHK